MGLPPDKYAHERGAPAVPQCGRSSLSINFDGHMLVLRSAHVQFSWQAVSGRPDGRGDFDYSLARQGKGEEGPIPEGEYWIDPAEIWERPWYEFVKEPAWGNHRVTLHVMPGTRTRGRGGFFIHGGNTPGSAGCIDLTTSMDRFVARLRSLLQQSPNCFVPVRVQY